MKTDIIKKFMWSDIQRYLNLIVKIDFLIKIIINFLIIKKIVYVLAYH